MFVDEPCVINDEEKLAMYKLNVQLKLEKRPFVTEFSYNEMTFVCY